MQNQTTTMEHGVDLQVPGLVDGKDHLDKLLMYELQVTAGMFLQTYECDPNCSPKLIFSN